MTKKDVAKFLLEFFSSGDYVELSVDKRPAFRARRIGNTSSGDERWVVGVDTKALKDFIKKEEK